MVGLYHFSHFITGEGCVCVCVCVGGGGFTKMRKRTQRSDRYWQFTFLVLQYQGQVVTACRLWPGNTSRTTPKACFGRAVVFADKTRVMCVQYNYFVTVSNIYVGLQCTSIYVFGVFVWISENNIMDSPGRKVFHQFFLTMTNCAFHIIVQSLASISKLSFQPNRRKWTILYENVCTFRLDYY
jgi:hypothetical protein